MNTMLDILAFQGALALDAATLATLLASSAAILAALVARRRLPTGVSEGLFIMALSVLLMRNISVLAGRPADTLFWLGAGFAALSVFWLVVITWVERTPAGPLDEARDRQQLVRRGSGTAAAVVAGLCGAGILWQLDHLGAVRPGALLLPLVVLLLGGVMLHARRRSILTAVGLAGWIILVLRCYPPALRLTGGPFVLLGAAATILLVVLAIVLADRARRCRVWHTDPQRLLDPVSPHPRLYTLITSASVLVGLGAVLWPDAVVTPLTMFLVGFAVLTAGHRRRSNGLGALGLGLTHGGVVLAAVAWLPASPANLLLGACLAGGHLLWLTRFWNQQLDEGRPWTTAGRLIPVARALSYTAAGLIVVAAAAWAVTPGPTPAWGGWQTVTALVALLLFASMLVRTAHRHDCSLAAGAACGVLGAAIVPAMHVGIASTLWSPGLVAALLGVLLALRVRGAVPVGAAWVYNAALGGVLPLVVTLAGARQPSWSAGLLSAAGVCTAWIAWWGRRPRVVAAAPAQ